MKTPIRKRYPGLAVVFLMVGGLVLACFLWVRAEQRRIAINRELIEAIKVADAQTVVDLLNRGADPNACDSPDVDLPLWRLLWGRIRGDNRAEKGTSALVLAVDAPCQSPGSDREAYHSSVKIVRALLDRGATMHGTDVDGFEVVYKSLQCSSDIKMLSLLIQHHADVNVHSPAGGRTPLMNASGWGNEEEIGLLLDAGARIDDRDDTGDTALMYAVGKARDDNVAPLLARHADPSIKNRSGASPLSVAEAGLASNVTTSFNHGEQHESWSNIVHLLKEAKKRAEATRKSQ